MEMAMETSPAGVGDVERGTASLEGDQHELSIVGAGDSRDDGIPNNESCEVPKGLVSDVPDPPNHKLTSGCLTDSAVDVTSTDTTRQSYVTPSSFITGDLMAMLMSNMNADTDDVEPGDVSVEPDGSATTDDPDQDVVETSCVASDCDTPVGMATRGSETSFNSKKVIADAIDNCVPDEQLDDDSRTRSALNEQRSDSPSSGISSCSVDTGGYLEEKLNTSAEHCVADTTPQCVSSQSVESTSDTCTVDNTAPLPGDVDLTQSDSRYSDDAPSFVLPGEAFNVLRIASSEATDISLENQRAQSLHSTTSDAASTAFKCPSSSTHKLTASSDDVPDVRPGADTDTSLQALSRQYGVNISEKADEAGRVTCAIDDVPVNGASVDQLDHRRVRLASSLSSDSDSIPCGSRHSTNDGKQYVNLPMSAVHRDHGDTHRDNHVIVRSATVKQGGRPGSHIKVQVELGEKELGKLNRYDVHRLLERGAGRWQCDRHKGPHIVLMTLLFMPVALVASTAFCLYMGTVCWYNVLCYLYVEGTALHKALFCPLLVLAYPVVIFATAFGVGSYASVVQVSWSLLRWQQKVTDYEKGFYGWLCTALGVVQCAPYGVIVLNTDVAQTLEPAQDETEV